MPITRALATRALAGLSLTVALAGCLDEGERSVAMLSPGSSFTVARIDGVPAPQGVTLEVGEDGRVSGQAPCNRYSGLLTQKDGAMTVSGMVMTRMACIEPDRTIAESRFGNALAGITAARRVDGGIALIDPEGKERIGLVETGGN